MLRNTLVLALALTATTGCGGSFNVVSDSSAGAYEVALAPVQNRLVTAWYDTRDGNAEIYFRVLDEYGLPAGPERRLTSNPERSYEPSIEPLGADIAVAWYDKSDEGGYTSSLGVWDLEGRSRWSHPFAQHARNPVIRVHDGRIFAAWIQAEAAGDEAVWGGWWNANGGVVHPAHRLAPASRTTWNLNAEVDEAGTAWVVFDAVNGTRASELFAVRFANDSEAPVRLTSDDGKDSKYPDLAIEGSRAALTWFDAKDGNDEIYLLTLNVADLAGTHDVVGRRVTTTPGNSIGAYLRWNAGRIGLAWCDDTEGQDEIYFASFDGDGRQLGEAKRLTNTSRRSVIPAIRPLRSGFALAWVEYEPPVEDAHARGEDADAGSGGRGDIAVALVP